MRTFWGIRSKLALFAFVVFALFLLLLLLSVPYLLSSSEESEVLRIRFFLIPTVLLAFLITLGFILLSSFLINRALKKLSVVARSMSEGEFPEHVPANVEGKDQISELAHSLNQLVEQQQASWGAVRAERDLLKAVLEGMDEGVLVLDQEGRIARTNATLRSWTGIKKSSKGRKPIEVWRDVELEQAITSVFSEKEVVQVEINLPAPKERSLLGRVAPLAPSTNAGAVAVFHDVTELRRLERIRRDFVANVSHELRTPISAVQGAAETLLEGGLEEPKTARRFTDVINRHSIRLSLLLTDLLELARLESRATPFDSDSINLLQSVQETVSQLSESLTKHQLKTQIDIPPDLPAAAGDKRALARVLGNLVENAIHYTEPGGTIRFWAKSKKKKVVFEVSDTGMGIEARHLPRIFERFYRADAGRSRDKGGTGLGLAIVKHLVQAMRGEVSVSSVVGKGTTFRITLKRF